MKKDNNNKLIIVLIFAVGILVFFFPTIYKKINNHEAPKVFNKKTDIIKEKKNVTEDTFEIIHFPLMRNSIYDSNTYYSLDKFKISDMSNNDILYNAFLDVYEGNMIDYNGTVSCTNSSKKVSTDYIKLRVKNILGRDVKFEYQNFYVPEDSKSKYPGNWIISGSDFIYDGLCNSKVSETKYYDLTTLIDAKYVDDDIVIKYYVGFAKVVGNNYTIYNDAKMTNSIASGTGVDDLQNVFDNLDSKVKKIYQYTFNNTLCTYDEYCLYEGKWVNE